MNRNTRATHVSRPGSAGLAALVLAALTLFSALAVQPVQAAEWMTPYLEQVQEWGVMRGDVNGNLHEDRPITRAEFVTLVNRAFGYTEVGPHTFTDVRPSDWYAEDISIAHQAGYFQGTSPTTAAPMNLVTREQAAVLLGRSLRFQGVTGAANSTFDDMRDIGGWSRPFVQEAADMGIIQGYSDGTFKPDLPITRGQMACFLVRALGTLIQEKGEQSAGGVYGNLTITVPGVKLKDTTITGNLYLTGGVGLGNLELENVNVLGKIIVCGSGEAERGEHSIILRNVTAPSLEIDSLAGQFLSVHAEGLTDIGTTTVRTDAFIQDLTEDGLGLRSIRLEGEDGARLQLAGNIKDVINLTPASALQMAQGTAGTITVDERAVDSTLVIDDKAVIKELNLDHGISVTGQGSITHLNINAPDANVSMLPDTFTIRPGITGIVKNQQMNNITAAESSEDPRILAGYPLARNVAPTSAEAVFRTNKAGTIRWALTALMDGSVGEEELINPSNYSAKIIRSGSLNVATSNTDAMARITGLTREGSYYISALLEDARGHRSPVKVATFTTPDDTAPNFANGYPQDPILTTDADNEQIAQIMVMPTKDCQMYYVLLPRGSTAPTPADFRSAALPGNLGFGIVTLRKNTPFLVSRINTSHLQEQTTYDLYLWLNDADNGKSSTVRRIQLTTKDMTPPTILKMDVKAIGPRTVTMTFSLDEPGMIYWAVVEADKNFYASGIDKNNPGQVGQIQIENGTGSNVVRRGGPIRAARGGTDYDFTITGLEPQTAYDLYYVAKDTAGNYCVYTQALTPPKRINTEDGEPPTVKHEFENDASPEGQPNTTPYPNTDVRLVFSEAILGYQLRGRDHDYCDDFLAAYDRVVASSGEDRVAAEREFADLLHSHIKLFNASTRQEVVYRTADNEDSEDWVLDFRKATVYPDAGEMIIAFPYSENTADSAVNLGSGETYYFLVSNIADNSDAHNELIHNTRNGFQLPNFTTRFATVYLSNNDDEETVSYTDADGTSINNKAAKIFLLEPENTDTVSERTRWDMLIWTDTSFDYDLLVRAEGSTQWTLLGNLRPNTSGGEVYNSLSGNFTAQMLASGLFPGMVEGQGRPPLRQFTSNLEFAIVPISDTVERTINMRVQIYAGSNTELSNISVRQGSSTTLANRNVTVISEPESFPVVISPPAEAPEIVVPYLGIKPGSIAATVQVSLRGRPGMVHYMAIPIENSNASGTNYTIVGAAYPEVGGNRVPLERIPTSSKETDQAILLDNKAPDPRDVVQGNNSSTRIRTGRVELSGEQWMSPNRPYTITIPNLDPETTYILYLASTDSNSNPSDNAICYKFTTSPPKPPVVTVSPSGTTGATIAVSTPSDDVAYVLVANTYFSPGSSNVFARAFTVASGLVDPTAELGLPSGFSGTVLDAMLRTHPGSPEGYSVFDVCASASAKQEYAGYIRSPNNIFVNPTPADDDNNFSIESQTNLISFDLPGTNYHTLIVVARGRNSDQDGFRASQSYYKQSLDYLRVQDATSLGQNTDSNPERYFTGKAYIYFSDNLHVRVQGVPTQNEETAYRVDTCQLGHTEHAQSNHNIASSNNCVNIGAFMTAPSTMNLSNLHTSAGHNGTSIVSTLLEFDFRKAESGQSIVLGRGGNYSLKICGSNPDVRNSAPDLTVKLVRDAATGTWSLQYDDLWRRNVGTD